MSWPARLSTVLAGWLAALACGTAQAMPAADRPEGSFVLRAGVLYPVTAEQPGPVADGVVVVRDGKIVAAGPADEVEIPADLPVVHLPDAHVCPGFVDAGSAVVPAHVGIQSVSAAHRAVDAFDVYGDFRPHLARGVTSVHVNPGGHRLVSGVGAVVRLGGPPGQRVLRDVADLTINLGVFSGELPLLGEAPFYASADVAIEPFARQRPTARIGQLLELDERLATYARYNEHPENFAGRLDLHNREFARLWAAKTPLRVQARAAVDVEAALSFLSKNDRPAYLVGLTQGDRLAQRLAETRVPVVLRLEDPFSRPTFEAGDDPETLVSDPAVAGRLARAGVVLALAGREDEAADPTLIAALAVRGGLSPAAALAGITRVPAELLGVGDRVGSLAPGRDADLLILSGSPVEVGGHVLAAYVAGRPVFQSDAVSPGVAPAAPALVLRADTVWVGNGQTLSDAEVLVEGGRIKAVARRVGRPAGARFIDGGPGSFLTPGFIDAHGHLGLDGDRTTPEPDLPIERVIGAASERFLRVARAGVTSVLLAPYGAARDGSRVAAIKTYGATRDELVTRPVAAMKFRFEGDDPLTGAARFKALIDKARQYDEAWKKYEEELAKWRAGEVTSQPAEKPAAKPVEAAKVDPLSGTWEYTLSGGPMPEPYKGDLLVRLSGEEVEARLKDPTSSDEVPARGTFRDDKLVLEVERDSPVGRPRIEATLDKPDHLKGTLKFGSMFALDFEANRTDARSVEFKVQRSKRSKDGRPPAPEVDEKLEPLRALLAGKAAALVSVQTPAQIRALLRMWVDELKLPLVLLGAPGAADVVAELTQRREHVGVVPPANLGQTRLRRPYVAAADLSGQGVPVALQSDSEDAARNLPLMALYAVRAGMGGDAALRAMTSDAARMFRLDDRIGTIEVGKDGDLVLHSGYPFDAGSRVERVIVGGREVPQP